MAGRVGWPAAVVAALMCAVLTGCGVADGAESAAPSPSYAPPNSPPNAPPNAPPAAAPATPPPAPPAATQTLTGAVPGVEPRRSWLSIPAIGVTGVPVVRYRGTPDDGPGTRIQNRGPAASPRGPGGGVGPGEIGNFIVTGHRTTDRAPFRDLPSLAEGARVLVRSGDTVYEYVVTQTRRVSFRSARSKARQVAAVPGRPREAPVEPMITLSTCATPEDHAAGNFWADRFDNPEHRIDKIGVLTRVRAAG